MKQLFSFKISLFILLALIMLGDLTSCSERQANTIRVGEYYPLTGELATFGKSGKNGIELALEEANNAGGLLGKKIEVIVEDDRGKQEEAKTVVQKLIDKDKVIAVLGESASTNSIA